MGCEYCNGDKRIIANNDRGIIVLIDDFEQTLDIAWYGESGWDAESISIMYCPLCGAKLDNING